MRFGSDLIWTLKDDVSSDDCLVLEIAYPSGSPNVHFNIRSKTAKRPARRAAKGLFQQFWLISNGTVETIEFA